MNITPQEFRKLDVISGKAVLFILKELAVNINKTNREELGFVTTVMAMAVAKTFLSIRGAKGKASAIDAFHEWTGLVHKLLTEPSDEFLEMMRDAHQDINCNSDAEELLNQAMKQ